MASEYKNSSEFVHEQSQPTRVTDYLSASQDDDPFLYPGERPAGSYVTDGEFVQAIDVVATADGLQFNVRNSDDDLPLNTYLYSKGAPRMEDRIPVLAFGANMSPGSLKSKFTKIGRPDALVVPTIYGELAGHDIVWSGGPGVNGNFIAILYHGEEAQDTTVQVGVNFLTREQLLVMHATELSYDLASIDVTVADEPLRAYYYAGHDDVYLQDGHPVAIESVAAEGRTLTVANTVELLENVLSDETAMDIISVGHPRLTSAGIEDYRRYAEDLRSKKGARLALKALVHDTLRYLGNSKEIASEPAQDNMMSWSNPSTIPTYGEWKQGIYHHDVYRLPNQEIPQWADAERRKKVLRALTTTHYKRSRNRIAPRE